MIGEVGVLLDEVVVGDVEVEGAAAGDEAVHLRVRFEIVGDLVLSFRSDSQCEIDFEFSVKKARRGDAESNDERRGKRDGDFDA